MFTEKQKIRAIELFCRDFSNSVIGMRSSPNCSSLLSNCNGSLRWFSTLAGRIEVFPKADITAI
ncbi:hypothetical protein BR170_002301 [Escherichia coli]|uniref:hypothetical protein n=1 Tax=Escherichia coli TaxID=562 RepID=UPI0017FD851D|nr:hypothetical protein [Escherichia coli]HDI7942643.1 hypothetical protein [Escherichia coli]